MTSGLSDGDTGTVRASDVGSAPGLRELMPDEEYRRRGRQVLQGIDYGPKHVLTVSDAEILALDGAERRQPTPLLSLRERSEDDRDRVAHEVGHRLLGQGHTDDRTPLGGPSSTAPEPTVGTVLALRRSWLCLLSVDQVTAYGRFVTTAYLRADRRAMVEVTNQTGIHRFTVMKRAVALDYCASALTPFVDVDTKDQDGWTCPVDAWQEEVSSALSNALVASAVISRRQDRTMSRGREDRLAVYNLQDRTEVLSVEGDGHVRVAPTSRRTLRSHLESITTPIGPRPEAAS